MSKDAKQRPFSAVVPSSGRNNLRKHVGFLKGDFKGEVVVQESSLDDKLDMELEETAEKREPPKKEQQKLTRDFWFSTNQAVRTSN